MQMVMVKPPQEEDPILEPLPNMRYLGVYLFAGNYPQHEAALLCQAGDYIPVAPIADGGYSQEQLMQGGYVGVYEGLEHAKKRIDKQQAEVAEKVALLPPDSIFREENRQQLVEWLDERFGHKSFLGRRKDGKLEYIRDVAEELRDMLNTKKESEFISEWLEVHFVNPEFYRMNRDRKLEVFSAMAGLMHTVAIEEAALNKKSEEG